MLPRWIALSIMIGCAPAPERPGAALPAAEPSGATSRRELPPLPAATPPTAAADVSAGCGADRKMVVGVGCTPCVGDECVASSTPAPRPFERRSAHRALQELSLEHCRHLAPEVQSVRGRVSWSNDGSIGKLTLDPPYADTPLARCVTDAVRSLRIVPFDGAPQEVSTTFVVRGLLLVPLVP